MKNRVVEINDNIVAIRSGHIDGVKTKIQTNIDHNTLNNVRSNLREVSKEQNAQNISSTLSSLTHCRNVTIEEGK